MKIRITGFDGRIYTLAANEVVSQYLKVSFWLSWLIPFGAYQVYELIKPYLEIAR